MSEEKHRLQRQADRARTNHRRSIASYLIILFGSAIILLLLAYLMEQRSANEQAISGLQQSVSAMQSAQDLYEENGLLKEKITQMEETMEQLNEQVALMQDKIDRQETLNQNDQQKIEELLLSGQAMDWFWQIDEAFVLGRYNLCRELITQLNAAGLTESLPRQSITENGRFSPYDRYLEIYDALY